jgi:hypothetical protein
VAADLERVDERGLLAQGQYSSSRHLQHSKRWPGVLEAMRVWVTGPVGESIPLEVSPGDSCKTVKKKIGDFPQCRLHIESQAKDAAPSPSPLPA